MSVGTDRRHKACMCVDLDLSASLRTQKERVNRRDLQMKVLRSGDADVSAAVKPLTANPAVISMSAISRKQAKQKQSIAIIAALIILPRSPECLLNRVIALKI